MSPSNPAASGPFPRLAIRRIRGAAFALSLVASSVALPPGELLLGERTAGAR